MCFLNRYRNRLEIIRDILLAVSVNDGAKKTRIMYGANLGYKVLMRYLRELLKAGLLDHDGESHYRLTDKGERFLRLYKDYERDYSDLKDEIDNLEKEKKSLRKIVKS